MLIPPIGTSFRTIYANLLHSKSGDSIEVEYITLEEVEELIRQYKQDNCAHPEEAILYLGSGSCGDAHACTLCDADL